jgi:hypothetical protein
MPNTMSHIVTIIIMCQVRVLGRPRALISKRKFQVIFSLLRRGNSVILHESATGFQAEPLEKVRRLLELIESLRSHPFLKERIALKGGTALNLFVFKMPRLSVDIDLNYIGSKDREIMLSDRPKIEQATHAVCGRQGMQVKRFPEEHAGGKWRLTYMSESGRPGTLELDTNFLLRTPLWPPLLMDSHPIGSMKATKVPVLDLHELADYLVEHATKPLGKLRTSHYFRDTADTAGKPDSVEYRAFKPGTVYVMVAGGDASPMMQAHNHFH